NNKFRQIYIELPRFMKSEADCDSFLEYWIYNLVNMNKLKEISFKDRKAIFGRLEKLASQANLTEEERWRLEEDWKNYNDFFNTLDFAKEEGRAEGLEKGIAEGEQRKRLEIAKNLKSMGLPPENIMQATGLTIEEINNL
ncbi:MAG: PD-(D/E)XK nuclease family transposase, partial [Bacteroidaceae bacterium]|nr:PD-(D/E)XK nuclease family transposase [Bacteroidaceae bacterium]